MTKPILELRDLIVTPILLCMVYAVAYIVRPWVTDPLNRRYFIPALTVRIVAALAVGFLYQFYYNGGDTFNYHTHGSRPIWEAFVESPEQGMRLLFADGKSHLDIYKYSSRIPFFSDPSSYNVIRLSAVFDLFTFSSYSATATLFAIVSFIGMWLFFVTFYSRYPHLHRSLAIATLFIPSVFFWGSGLLKDTITLACLGAATYCCNEVFVKGNYRLWRIGLLVLSLFTLYSIKLYILLNFLPAAIFWIFLARFRTIPSRALQILLFPLVVAGSLSIGYWAIVKASEDNAKYSLKAIGETARITAYDIRYYTGKDAGSGYSLGELDGSLTSMLQLAPQAVNVSLFRPYLWEVRNPLMLLSALESLAFFLIVCYLIFRYGAYMWRGIGQPDVLFALFFSITFAFAVGVSTFNFGTLARYKIPAMPFFLIALILIWDHAKRERKLRLLAATE